MLEKAFSKDQWRREASLMWGKGNVILDELHLKSVRKRFTIRGGDDRERLGFYNKNRQDV